MSKVLARLGLKFSKQEAESFRGKYSQVIRIECETRLPNEQYEQLIAEIRKSKTSEKAIVEPILSRMEELANLIKQTVEEPSRVKSSEVKEPRDLMKEVERLLSEKGELRFTQLLNELQTTAPTLSKHLERMLAESKLERREVGPNVLYKLKEKPVSE